MSGTLEHMCPRLFAAVQGGPQAQLLAFDDQHASIIFLILFKKKKITRHDTQSNANHEPSPTPFPIPHALS